MPKNRENVYVDLKGREISLVDLDKDERKLVDAVRERAKQRPEWNDFDTFWLKTVADFYGARGMSRAQSRQTTAYQIAQDLSSCLAIAAGLAQRPDYRDELGELIQSQFKTRRAFCEVTGLSEDMLSHVLAHRKHLSLETLNQVLDRIGYTLRISPRTDRENSLVPQ